MVIDLFIHLINTKFQNHDSFHFNYNNIILHNTLIILHDGDFESVFETLVFIRILLSIIQFVLSKTIFSNIFADLF